MTNKEKILSMSDEELEDFFREIYNTGSDDATAYDWGSPQYRFSWDTEWLNRGVSDE